MENISKEQKKIIKSVDKVLEAINVIIPSDWSKGQVASVLGVYLELYK